MKLRLFFFYLFRNKTVFLLSNNLTNTHITLAFCLCLFKFKYCGLIDFIMYSSRSLGFYFPTKPSLLLRKYPRDSSVSFPNPRLLCNTYYPPLRYINQPTVLPTSYSPTKPFSCEFCGLRFFNLINKLAHQANYCWKRDSEYSVQDEISRIRNEHSLLDNGYLPDIITRSDAAVNQSYQSMSAYRARYNQYLTKKLTYEQDSSSNLNASTDHKRKLNNIVNIK